MEGTLFLPLLLLALASSAASTTTAPTSESGLSFIKSSCNATVFPDVCYSSLASYAPVLQHRPDQLANTALIVSLNRAKSAHSFVSWLASRKTDLRLTGQEAGALNDCVDFLSNAVNTLRKTVGELKMVEGSEFQSHIDNACTWVGGAMTDEETCLDGFLEIELESSRVRAMVRKHVGPVTQVTSNALAEHCYALPSSIASLHPYAWQHA